MATPAFNPFDKQKLAEEAKRDAQILETRRKTEIETQKRKKRLVLETELARITRELTRMQTEKIRFEKDLEQAEERAQAAKIELERLQKELQKEERKIPEAERKMKVIDQYIRTIKQKITSFTQRLTGKKSSAGVREETLRQHHTKIETLKRAIEGFTVEERKIAEEIRALQAKLDRDKTERFQAEEEIKNLKVYDDKQGVEQARESALSHGDEDELKKLEKEEAAKQAELKAAESALEKEKKEKADLETKRQALLRTSVADKERVRSAGARTIQFKQQEEKLTAQKKKLESELDTLRRP